jgi:hypothetical protein
MKAVTDLDLFQGLLLGLLGLSKYHYGEIGKADSHAERQNIRKKTVMLWGHHFLGAKCNLKSLWNLTTLSATLCLFRAQSGIAHMDPLQPTPVFFVQFDLVEKKINCFLFLTRCGGSEVIEILQFLFSMQSLSPFRGVGWGRNRAGYQHLDYRIRSA